ncbi:exodeoxyribonuclease VII small subunit XseB [methanogenic archaeon mixed culture ISO4-G1]|nr:exodeoxyribonuclease VII small subunit XseB [methanogenic archaeon mixed culture ISO4-G1]
MSELEEQIEKMTFEESIAALEDLVYQLENGGLDLDKSIEVYERAVLLRNHCKKLLDDGERRIKKIIETSEGIKTEDFQAD